MTDLDRTRQVLASLQRLHELRHAALEKSGLASFLNRADWLLDHPISDWLPVVADVEAHRLVLVDSSGALCTCGDLVPVWLEHLGRIALLQSGAKPTRSRASKFTDRQMEIALDVLTRRAA